MECVCGRRDALESQLVWMFPLKGLCKRFLSYKFQPWHEVCVCLHVCVYKGSLRTGNLRSDVNRQHLVSSTLPPQRLVSLQTAAASVGCFSQTKHGGRAALAETRAPAETQRRSMYRGSDWLALSHIWITSQHLWLHPHTRRRHEERGNTLLEIFRSQLDDTEI